ncbi:MAG: hypothetical protein ACE5I7_14375 [Candidatus Binatia bacterium]
MPLLDVMASACYPAIMPTTAYKARRKTRRVSGRRRTIGVDLLDAKKDLSAPKRRSARLIESVLREAGSAEGPPDLSSNLRGYLDQR